MADRGRGGPESVSQTPAGEALLVGNLEEVQGAVRDRATLLPRAGGTKSALSTPPAGVQPLSFRGLTGVVEYLPQEYTITVRPATRVDEVERLLASEGQFLPFDPLLTEAGATMGGTVAAGTNGPGRLRFGGVRDFLLGVRFVDGRGRVVQGGGRVVKNAAGFDLPKLMVGSLGRLGVLVELTFKVFPAPEARRSLRVEQGSVERCLEVWTGLRREPLELEAMEIEPPGRLWIRIAGRERGLDRRLERLESVLAGLLGGGADRTRGEITRLSAREARLQWRRERELAWAPEGASLVKVPLTPRSIPELESLLAGAGLGGEPTPGLTTESGHGTEVPRRYGGGGQQLLLAWRSGIDELDRLLARTELSGMVLRGPGGVELLGKRPAGADAFAARVKRALDPEGAFPPLPVPRRSGSVDDGT